MQYSSNLVNPNLFAPHIMRELKFGTYTLDAGAANVTLIETDATVVFCDPGGGAIDLTLPAEKDGLSFIIFNTADAAEDITVKDDGAGTIATVAQNEGVLVICNGTVWKALVGPNT